MTINHVALYLRSSKDRADVSIQAQRRELQALARKRGFVITAEYVDTVESAKTENRPQYQKLVADLAKRDRPWSKILAVDTSRIARRIAHAYVFEYECQRRGVDIIFSKLPETDNFTSVILEAVFRAFDELHSLMSRDKGLAGMKENIARGWRAGGRAPWGYQLEHTETATMRQGEPVRKSRLIPSTEAPLVARYLKRRAAGDPRARVCKDLGIKKSASTLVCVEWNALTYAGFTVWNVHAEKEPNGKGYKGGHKRRPRQEWVIQPETHEALITRDEAETLIARLQDSDIGQRVSSAKAGADRYLLTSLLMSPDGRRWTGHRQSHYRLKPAEGGTGRLAQRQLLEEAVVHQLLEDLGSPEFAEELVKEAQSRLAPVENNPTAELRAEHQRLTDQISKAMDLCLSLADPSPALRKVDELEHRRSAISKELDRLQEERRTATAVASVTPEQLTSFLRERVEDLLAAEPSELRPVVESFVERVVLDPDTMECAIHYNVNRRPILTRDTPGNSLG